MSQPKDYDSTVARIAGNIAAGFVANHIHLPPEQVADTAVVIARLIVAEVKRTEP